MTAWHYILGAYAVTAILVVVEIVSVRLRQRAAQSLAEAGHEPPDERAAAANIR
jgi:hypothetical protein